MEIANGFRSHFAEAPELYHAIQTYRTGHTSTSLPAWNWVYEKWWDKRDKPSGEDHSKSF